MSSSPTSSSDSHAGQPIGRRGWFKQAGVAAAGLTLGSKLAAGPAPDVAASVRSVASSTRDEVSPVQPRPGIDCGFDEGPI